MTTTQTFEPHGFEPYTETENICRHCDRGRYALHHLRYEQSSTTQTSEQCADDCHFGDHNEPPAPRAGERDDNHSLILDSFKLERLLRATGEPTVAQALLWIQERRREHNQHATLVEQRERLVEALQRWIDAPKCARIDCCGDRGYHDALLFNAKEAIRLTAIEQEGEVSR